MQCGKGYGGKIGWGSRFCLTVTLLIAVSIGGCQNQSEPVKLGFLGGLTGRVADLGVAGRDGMILAVEQQNLRGGIQNRKIVIVTRDDRQSEKVAREAFQELVDERVAAVVGPMTSQIGVVVSALADSTGTVVISPTVKAPELTRKDDHFFRVIPSLDINATYLADYLRDKLEYDKVAFVYDMNNRAFSEPWFEIFKSVFDPGDDGKVVGYPFRSASNAPFQQIAETVVQDNPEGVVVIASAIDTAFVFQQLRKIGNTTPGFASQWSFTGDLINYGGKAVEGLRVFHAVDPDSPIPAYRKFNKDFKDRFGYDPSFAGQLSYEATGLLLAALGQKGDNLKQNLLDIDSYHGLQGPFRLDPYGDVERDLILTCIENGQFKVVADP
ncbi:MAG: ABC transporter substrate-binding protein [Desulfuromonas sp.]|nr:MAG: ABC transporter substrate-binding protein [Desulfuromonas sp.]